MKRNLGIILGVALLVTLGSARVFTLNESAPAKWDANSKVADVLTSLGAPESPHRPANMTPEMVEQGRELIETGVTTGPDGRKTRLQSRYFVCTNCHNMSKEDPDLRSSDPAARLSFTQKRNLPFLQGTTLYGTVNKVSWYNGDYYKKYGDLVKPANKSLREAIQLCAQVCSQGRAFEEWEMDAVLAYFWSIQLRLGDLALTTENYEQLQEFQAKREKNSGVVDYLKGLYQQGSPATFAEVPENKEEGYAAQGNAENGRLIYDASCLACHDREGPSKYLKLDHGDLSLGMLRRNIGRPGHLSLYEIIRHGTYADHGHRAYMPHFPAERMSDSQIEDLRAYVESGD